MMEIKYLCTFWGCETQTAKEFLSAAIENGYNGVEINFPDDRSFISQFLEELNTIRNTIDKDFVFIAQQVLPNKNETVSNNTKRISERLEFLATLGPDYINSHTGKDFFGFSENCDIINVTERISQAYKIPIWHEIHRGRFSFHLKTLLNYLEVYPQLNLIADFSHFCTVSESLLQDQQDILKKIYPNIRHIHARIGFSQSPQVNNPFAPEWKICLEQFTMWWQQIIDIQKKRKVSFFTITPEFGPFPYMPLEPFTRKPLANQWEINLQMKNYLQQNLKL
jgi:sugar phosphate isomerase/epimerase